MAKKSQFIKTNDKPVINVQPKTGSNDDSERLTIEENPGNEVMGAEEEVHQENPVTEEPKQEDVELPNQVKAPVFTDMAIFIKYFVPGYSSISEEDIYDFREILKDRKALVINLILHSNGGDPYAAASIAKILRKHCFQLNIIVLSHAMSAASLLALSGNQIFLAEGAFLGPLDMQIPHPTEENNIAAYDYVFSQSTITSITDIAASTFFNTIRNKPLKIKTIDMLRISQQAAVELYKPVVEKLEPSALSMSSRILKVAERYATEFLRDYSLNSNLKGNQKYAELIASQLVYQYPSHGFAIFIDELIGKGINASEANSLSFYSQIWDIMRSEVISDSKVNQFGLRKIIEEIDVPIPPNPSLKNVPNPGLQGSNDN